MLEREIGRERERERQREVERDRESEGDREEGRDNHGLPHYIIIQPHTKFTFTVQS